MSEIERLVQEAQLLAELVDRTAEIQTYGSFSERNPAAGRMKTCPYCRIRERNHQCRANLTKPCDSGKSLVKGKRLKPRGEN